jgi:methyl-accepting chemotaxis protein
MLRQYAADLRVRTKLALMVLLPLAFLVVFSASAVIEKMQVARDMANLRPLAELSARISALVHELQAERGETGLFLVEGESGAYSLRAQRVRVSPKIAALRDSLRTFDVGHFGSAFAANTASAMAKLDSLQEHRRSVDARQIQGPEAIAFYTELDALLFRVIDQVSQVSADGDVTRRIAAYEDFLQAKERTGIEAVVGAVAFGQDKFAPGAFQTFTSCIVEEGLYRSLFLSLATPHQGALYARELDNAHVPAEPVKAGLVNEQTSRMRATAFERAATGQFGVDSAYWLAMMSAKIDALKVVEDTLSRELLTKAGASEHQASLALTVNLLVMSLVVLASVVMVLLIPRSITRPLARAVTVAQSIARGDLSTRIETTARDETGQLLVAMRTMTERLTDLLREVGVGAGELSSLAARVAGTSVTLSRGTGEQATSVKEAAVSLQEMTATVSVTAKNCGRMEQAALAGSRDADQAARTVRDTVEAMKSIASKVGLIEEIASRTNLLAINATIEAAGAGEYGRGFAVVAMEVRKLAERSTVSAREIRELMSSSLGIAARSGEMLMRLVPSIQTTAGLVQEVTVASKEQAIGIAQIQQAMTQLDGVTRDSAAAANAMSTAADQLSQRASGLRALMAFFRLAQHGSTPPTAAKGNTLLRPDLSRMRVTS